jgi:hypothetical protein
VSRPTPVKGILWWSRDGAAHGEPWYVRIDGEGDPIRCRGAVLVGAYVVTGDAPDDLPGGPRGVIAFAAEGVQLICQEQPDDST